MDTQTGLTPTGLPTGFPTGTNVREADSARNVTYVSPTPKKRYLNKYLLLQRLSQSEFKWISFGSPFPRSDSFWRGLMTYGLGIIARSLSVATGGSNGYAHGNLWQYHPRSDRHSKIVCWAIFFDLLLCNGLLRRHVEDEKVSFGIHHQMRDFTHDRAKDLDLVVCRRSVPSLHAGISCFADMANAFSISLSPDEFILLNALPYIPLTGVQTALIALEAKAAFTEFGKARPRLYDELNSSHLTIHGDTDSAIAAGLAMVNGSKTFISPLKNPWKLGVMPTVVNRHVQPHAARGVVEKVEQLPRRSAPGQVGFDAMGVIVLSCANDGSPVVIEHQPPAPAISDAFSYDSFIERIDTIYSSRFSAL